MKTQRNQLPEKKTKSRKSKSVHFEDPGESSEEEDKPKKQYYKYHGLCSHSTDQSTSLNDIIKKHKKKHAKKASSKKGKKSYSKQKVNALAEKRVKKGT